MIPVLVLLVGIFGWLVSVTATVWYLKKFHELHQEMQTIRRYLQAMYERMEQR